MGYTVISASKFKTKFKATVHKSGKLGFTDATARELGFDKSNEPYVKFARDDEDPSTLYLINVRHEDEDAFRVYRAGNYYYVNTKLMFDSLGVDYKTVSVAYDMIKLDDENEEGEVYKMNKRIIKRSEKEV